MTTETLVPIRVAMEELLAQLQAGRAVNTQQHRVEQLRGPDGEVLDAVDLDDLDDLAEAVTP